MVDAPADLRLRRLAAALHELGPRPIYEFLREIEAGADVRETLEIYARLPSAFIRANCADKFQAAAFAIGGHANG
jgi:hypothetical protein